MKHLRGPPPQTSSPRALNHSDECRTLAFASSGTSGGDAVLAFNINTPEQSERLKMDSLRYTRPSVHMQP